MLRRRTSVIDDSTTRDEEEVAGLDAQTEEQQRRWNVRSRQPGLAEPARKAQTMHQPEGQGHDPGAGRGDARAASAQANDLGRNEDDAKGDDRLDRPLRHVHEAERCRGRA